MSEGDNTTTTETPIRVEDVQNAIRAAQRWCQHYRHDNGPFDLERQKNLDHVEVLLTRAFVRLLDERDAFNQLPK